MFAIQNAAEWCRFCEVVMEAPSLAEDARFKTNADRLTHRLELERLITERFSSRTRAQVSALLESADLATATVNDVPAVAAHEQLAARQRWTTVRSPSGVIPALIPPHNLRSVSPRMGDIPRLGEHTEEVLREIAKT
jgi:crotonobetainyl-CoA:carnitine CoA-transferase CaiB-like acyl-CoA transferase